MKDLKHLQNAQRERERRMDYLESHANKESLMKVHDLTQQVTVMMERIQKAEKEIERT